MRNEKWATFGKGVVLWVICLVGVLCMAAGGGTNPLRVDAQIQDLQERVRILESYHGDWGRAKPIKPILISRMRETSYR